MCATELVMHIPKTAGLTLRAFLEACYPPGQVLGFYRPWIEGDAEQRRELNDPRIRLVIGHFSYGVHNAITCESRYSTFLRNPLTQVVSHFNYLARSREIAHARLMAACDHTLDGFLEQPWGRNVQTQCITGWTREQIEARPNEAVALVRHHLQNVFHFVGVTERFSESLYLLCKELGRKPHFFPSVNRADSKDVRVRRGDLSRAQLDRIAKVNFCDVEAAHLATQLFEHRLNRSPLEHLAARVFSLSNRSAIVAEPLMWQVPKPVYAIVPRQIRRRVIAALTNVTQARAA